MILYLDTSALVKLYVTEEHSARVRRAVAQFATIASNLIAYAETRAALSRRHRMRDITAGDFGRAKRDFERGWKGFTVLLVDREIIRRAAELSEQLGLRAYDAVHPASADRLHRDTQSVVSFACFDNALPPRALECDRWQSDRLTFI